MCVGECFTCCFCNILQDVIECHEIHVIVLHRGAQASTILQFLTNFENTNGILWQIKGSRLYSVKRETCVNE